MREAKKRCVHHNSHDSHADSRQGGIAGYARAKTEMNPSCSGGGRRGEGNSRRRGVASSVSVMMTRRRFSNEESRWSA